MVVPAGKRTQRSLLAPSDQRIFAGVYGRASGKSVRFGTSVNRPAHSKSVGNPSCVVSISCLHFALAVGSLPVSGISRPTGAGTSWDDVHAAANSASQLHVSADLMLVLSHIHEANARASPKAGGRRTKAQEPNI